MERLLFKVPQLLRSHHQLSAKPFANVIFVAFCTSQILENKMAADNEKSKTSLHEISAKDIDGNEVSVAGHPRFIANVGTQCYITKSNYKQKSAKPSLDGYRLPKRPRVENSRSVQLEKQLLREYKKQIIDFLKKRSIFINLSNLSRPSVSKICIMFKHLFKMLKIPISELKEQNSVIVKIICNLKLLGY